MASQVLVAYHAAEVVPDLLQLLQGVPHTTAPAEYMSFIPNPEGEPLRYRVAVQHWRETPDWVERSLAVCAAAERVVPGLVGWLGAALRGEPAAVLPGSSFQLDSAELAQWVHQRARDVDAQCGRVDLAREVLELGHTRHLPGLAEALADVQEVCQAVYDAGHHDLTLVQYQGMPRIDRLAFLLADLDEANHVERLLERAVPFLDRSSASERASLVMQWMESLVQRDPALCCHVLAGCIGEPAPLRPLIQAPLDVLRVGMACVAAARDGDVAIMSRIVQVLHRCGPVLEPECDPEATALQREFDAVTRQLSALGVLQKQGLSYSLAQVAELEGNASKCLMCIKKLINRGAHRPDKTMKACLEDLFRLHHTIMGCVAGETILLTFCQSLLVSGRLAFCGSYLFKPTTRCPPTPEVLRPGPDEGPAPVPAAEPASHGYFHKFSQISELTTKTATAVAKGVAKGVAAARDRDRDDFGLDVPSSAQLVLDCARNLLNSAVSIGDSNLALAAQCLALLDNVDCAHRVSAAGAAGLGKGVTPAEGSTTQDLQSAIQTERRLLECCSLLDRKFQVTLLPIQLRLEADAPRLVEDVLVHNETAYTCLPLLQVCSACACPNLNLHSHCRH